MSLSDPDEEAAPLFVLWRVDFVRDSLAQEPVLEKAWPHLQIVYEFFLRFVQSSAAEGQSSVGLR